MRIGLLALPLETGYGSILQAYALKTVLTRQGHEVILIRRLVKKKRFNGWNILKRSVKKYIFRKPACVTTLVNSWAHTTTRKSTTNTP